MKKSIGIAAVLLVLIIGGVYLAGRHEDAPVNTVVSLPSTTTDASTPEHATVVVPEKGSVTVGLNQSAAFKGFIATPVEVVEDSRCPAGVYCIQAGTVRVKVNVNSGLGSISKTVKLGDSMTVGSDKITFSSVDPLKTASHTIAPSEYRFTIAVEQI